MGLSWALCENGLPADNAFKPIAVAPSNPNTIAAGDGWELRPAIQNHVYISTDRGNTWVSATPFPEQQDVWMEDVEFDPFDENHLYVNYFSIGLYETFNRGLTWTDITAAIPIDPAYPDEPWLFGPAINPQNPSNLFVLSSLMGIYQSHDSGQSWESFSAGFDTTIVGGKIRFAPDDTTRLYLATAGRSVWSIHRTVVDAVDDGAQLPDKISLSAYPNPFNAQTTIQYSLPEQSQVTIDIFDILGRKIETLAEGIKPAGNHQAIWDASDQSSGIYIYRIKAGEKIETKKMVLLK
jgi:hypothetical protein